MNKLTVEEKIKKMKKESDEMVSRIANMIIDLPYLKDKIKTLINFEHMFSSENLSRSGIIQSHYLEYLWTICAPTGVYYLTDVIDYALEQEYKDELLNLAIEEEESFLERLFTDKERESMSEDYKKEMIERFLCNYIDDYMKAKVAVFHYC